MAGEDSSGGKRPSKAPLVPPPPSIPPPPSVGTPRPLLPLTTPLEPVHTEPEVEEPSPAAPSPWSGSGETADAGDDAPDDAAERADSIGMPRPQRLRNDPLDEQPTLPITPPQEAPPAAPGFPAPKRVGVDDTDALITDVANELIAFGEAQQREREAAEAREQQKSATATGEFETQDPVFVAVPATPRGLPLQGRAKWILASVVGLVAVVALLMLVFSSDEEPTSDSEAVAQAPAVAAPAPKEPTPTVIPAAAESDTGGDAATEAEPEDEGSGTGATADDDSAVDEGATDTAPEVETPTRKTSKKRAKRRRKRRSSDKPGSTPKKAPEPTTKKTPEKKQTTKPTSSAESRVVAACKRGDRNAAKAALKKVPLFQRRPVKKRCRELGVKL